jgi:glycosyltransferase involved in cell wall biosynthesis
MRIAYVITRADAVGGATIHVRDLARAMRRRGHDASVIVGGTGPVTEQLSAAGVPFHALASLQRAIQPVRDMRALGELTAAIRSLRPDLVSTHTAKAGWLGRAACARLGVPCIYTPHGWSVSARHGGRVGAVYVMAERIAARWADAIVCVCESERQVALAHRIGRPEQLEVIHNGVMDVEASLRAEPGEEPPRICSLARFDAPKDHATLLAAMGMLREERWTLDLIGDGPRMNESREAAAALGIADRLRFLGYLADPAPALAAAQMFVLSSRSEALPRSILEAMRAGLPVVASDVGGVREATDSVVPAGNAGALAEAVRILLRSPSERRARGAAGRRDYEERFTIERLVGSTEALYVKVLLRDRPQAHAEKPRR